MAASKPGLGKPVGAGESAVAKYTQEKDGVAHRHAAPEPRSSDGQKWGLDRNVDRNGIKSAFCFLSLPF
jgi:hypothetical protein